MVVTTQEILSDQVTIAYVDRIFKSICANLYLIQDLYSVLVDLFCCTNGVSYAYYNNMIHQFVSKLQNLFL